MNQRSLILLGAVALLLGAVTPMLASASEYDELGTVDEGVYEVTSEDSSFRVQAEEPLGLLVRSADGSVVDATELDAGEERTILLDGNRATVALTSGEATIEAKGEGSVDALATSREDVSLAEADDTAVDRSLAVQVPEGALLASAVLDGQARELDVHVAADGDTLLEADGVQLQTRTPLAPTTAEAEALDVEISVESLQGVVELSFLTLPDLEAAEDSGQEEASGALNARVEAHELAYEPVTFTVPADEAPGRLVVEIDAGHLLDASLYDANGAQIQHLHAGPPLEEHRSQCRGFHQCSVWWEGDEGMAPQTLEHEIDPGNYTLFVREAAVDAKLTLQDADGQPLLPEAERGEVASVHVHEDRELDLERPLLDVWRSRSHDDGQIDPRIAVDVGSQTVYAYEALAQGWEYSAASDVDMQPSAMQAGNVAVTVDETGEEFKPNRHGAVLVLPAS